MAVGGINGGVTLTEVSYKIIVSVFFLVFCGGIFNETFALV